MNAYQIQGLEKFLLVLFGFAGNLLANFMGLTFWRGVKYRLHEANSAIEADQKAGKMPNSANAEASAYPILFLHERFVQQKSAKWRI